MCACGVSAVCLCVCVRCVFVCICVWAVCLYMCAVCFCVYVCVQCVCVYMCGRCVQCVCVCGVFVRASGVFVRVRVCTMCGICLELLKIHLCFRI